MPGHQRGDYLPYVDGLRAVAVLSVLIYHLRQSWLPGGLSGVDVFFVISGFVVSASVGTRNDFKTFTFLQYFYARRLLRIAPALVVCLLITNVASTIFIPDSWLSNANQRTSLYAFFGLSNLVLATNRDSYFSPRAEFNPFTHTWSLGVEEQFYLVFPFVFLLWVIRHKRPQTIALFGLLLLSSLAYSAWVGQVDSNFAFYMFPSRFWELAAGVLLFQLMTVSGYWTTARDNSASLWFQLGAAVSIGLLVWGFNFADPKVFPFPGAVPSVIGAIGLLLFLYQQGSDNFFVRALTNRPMLYIGRISYSLYLWHWPVFVLFRWTVGLDSTIFHLLACALAFALAAGSYHFVEMPFRHSPALRQIPRYAIVAASLVIVAGTAWLSKQIYKERSYLSVSTVTRNPGDWYPNGHDTSAEHPGCILTGSKRPIGTGYVISRVRSGCDRAITGPRIFAVGDSHAWAYIPMLIAYAFETGAEVSIYSAGGCPFLSLQPLLENTETCRAHNDAAIADLLERLRPGDVLLLASLRLPRFVDQWVRFPDREVQDAMFGDLASKARGDAVDSAKRTLQPFQERRVRIVLEGPKPIFRSPTFRCTEFYNKTNEICAGGSEVDRTVLEELRRPVLDALFRLSEEVPGVRVWDPFAVLCPPSVTCSAYLDGRPRFFDADHLSAYGNRMLLPSFIEFVRAGETFSAAESTRTR